jgi:hypothetical protein
VLSLLSETRAQYSSGVTITGRSGPSLSHADLCGRPLPDALVVGSLCITSRSHICDLLIYSADHHNTAWLAAANHKSTARVPDRLSDDQYETHPDHLMYFILGHSDVVAFCGKSADGFRARWGLHKKRFWYSRSTRTRSPGSVRLTLQCRSNESIR